MSTAPDGWPPGRPPEPGPYGHPPPGAAGYPPPPGSFGYPAPPGLGAPGYPAPAAGPAWGGARKGRSPRGGGVWWRLGQSWWVLLPIFGSSCFGGIGFVYVGVRARRPSWWIPGIVYLIAGWGGFVGLGVGESEKASDGWFFGVWFSAWVLSVLHALVVNVLWLQWLADHRAGRVGPAPGWPGSAYPPGVLAPPPAPPMGGAFGSPAAGLPVLGQQGTYWAAGPAATTAPADPTANPPTKVDGPAAGSPAVFGPTSAPPVFGPAAGSPSVGAEASAAASSPVDVNAAGAEQLAALPGFDAGRAGRVLAVRQARRGFGSVAEFAAAAELAPHEYARLRDLLVCVPPAGPPAYPGASGGRVLDF